MLFKRITFIIAALPLTLTALACGETDDDPPAATDYERPEGSEEIVSNAELDEFNENGLDVNEGLNPPDVSGTYAFDDADVIYSSSDIYPSGEGGGCEYEETYEPGATDDEVLLTSEGTGNCDYVSEARSNFISGDGDCFTLYGELDSTFNGCEFTAVRVFSACIEDVTGDLIDPLFAEQMRAQTGDSCAGLVSDGLLPAEGDVYVAEERDGRAPKVLLDVPEVGDGSM